MANQIKIFDTTLRDGEQAPGCSMNLQEKIEVARQLERLKVDIIEAGFAIASPGDFNSVRTIAETIKDCRVASLARAVKTDIERAWEAVKVANAPRIHTFIATSPIHMKYKLKMTPDEVIERTTEMVKYAASLCPDIEFSAEDASRSERDFLVRVLEAAIDAGATVVNIPDTVGYTTPNEMYDLISYIKNNVRNIDRAEISVHCHNDLGMAVANSLMAIKAGATQVETTVNGLGERAGNSSMEEVVMSLATRRDFFDCECNIDTTQIYRTSKLLSNITGIVIPPNKAIVGANAFAHESGIHQHGILAERTTYEIMSPQSVGIPENKMVLGKHSGRHAFEERLRELGYNVSREELDAAFEQFKILADKKKVVSDKDIEALAGNKSVHTPEVYSFEGFMAIATSNGNSSATVVLSKDGKRKEMTALGDGPVDAAIKAVNLICGRDFILDDYNIHSVTEGEDALGEVAVKISYGGDKYVGRGVSTDIIEGSIKAYLNGINKLLNDE